MADITLTITKDGLTPSVVDVARAETLSVDFSGMSAWQSAFAVESGTVYAQQFDALMRPLGEDAFTLGSFEITLKPGACALDFRVRANATKVARNAVYDINGAFPVKVGGAGSGGSGDVVIVPFSFDTTTSHYTPGMTFEEVSAAIEANKLVLACVDFGGTSDDITANTYFQLSDYYHSQEADNIVFQNTRTDAGNGYTSQLLWEVLNSVESVYMEQYTFEVTSD